MKWDLGRLPPPFFFSKFPHFPVFLWQTSLRQQSHWHKLIEFMAFRNKFKLVLKELALYLSDNPQPILPQYRPMQVANVFNVFLHLTLALAGIGIGYGLAVDWRIGRWLTVFLYLWLISGKEMVLYRSYWHWIGVFVPYWWIVVMPDSLIFCPATGLLRKLAFYWYRFGSELAMCLLDWAGWRWWWFLFCLPNQTFVRFFWITSLNQLYFYTILRTTRPK